ncbi:hypothetical protein M9H77_36135 [Catharanthus roseus]|uniref:Uncharacterized protein n=1 Tax=Catharanthus roseus TaxID=4058 RepID=A0ACB9ZRT7_CATRO|nr:hypothetical protein M9H77_36135 [Catharanthus roseus]
MTSTENEQDGSAHELCVIVTDWESICHMLCRRHIDQNVLTKLTEMIKDEEVVSRFFNAKNNSTLKNVSNKISHLVLKKIWVEIKRAPENIDDPKNKYRYYLRTSHGLPCSCELITRFEHVLPIQLDDVEAFLRTLEIDAYHPCSQEKDIDMDYEMRDLAELFNQISI